MTTPVPITWAAGTVVTAAQLNSQVRDPMNYFLTVKAQSGVVLVSFTTQTSFSQAITFATALPTAPVMPAPNISSPAGVVGSWLTHANSVTATGFTLFLVGPSATWSNVPVHWLAEAQ